MYRSRNTQSNNSSVDSNKQYKDRKRSSGSGDTSFPYLFFIHKKYLDEFQDESQLISNLVIRNMNQDCEAYYDKQYFIPDVKGKVICIPDKQSHQVMNEGLEIILERLKNINKDKSLNILMLVPESLVSILIGNRGQMIRKIGHESKAEIVVNQPVQSMKHRTVKIGGKNYHCSKAFR